MIRLLVKSLARHLAKYDIEHADERTCCEYYEQALSVFVQGTPAEDQHGHEPDKVKPLAQCLGNYLDDYIATKGITADIAKLYGYTSFRELLQQALDAYESTEQVKIRIEPA